MTAKAPSKIELEICLEKLEIPGKASLRESAHLLQAQLLWPRVGIARRSSECEVRLAGGVCDMANAPWNQKILFRESADGRFALSLDLTVSLTRIQLRKWRLMTAGYILKAAGEAADDVGFAGELAEAPLKAAARDLQSAKPPELYASGVIDLSIEEFETLPPEGVLRKVPLTSALAITKITRKFHPLPHVGDAFLRFRPA